MPYHITRFRQNLMVHLVLLTMQNRIKFFGVFCRPFFITIATVHNPCSILITIHSCTKFIRPIKMRQITDSFNCCCKHSTIYLSSWARSGSNRLFSYSVHAHCTRTRAHHARHRHKSTLYYCAVTSLFFTPPPKISPPAAHSVPTFV